MDTIFKCFYLYKLKKKLSYFHLVVLFFKLTKKISYRKYLHKKINKQNLDR